MDFYVNRNCKFKQKSKDENETKANLTYITLKHENESIVICDCVWSSADHFDHSPDILANSWPG